MVTLPGVGEARFPALQSAANEGHHGLGRGQATDALAGERFDIAGGIADHEKPLRGHLAARHVSGGVRTGKAGKVGNRQPRLMK